VNPPTKRAPPQNDDEPGVKPSAPVRAASPMDSATFAANRAVGRIDLAVKQRGGSTRRGRLFESGPLRVRFPGPPAQEAEAVIVNTAGGVAGGDRLDLRIAVQAGAGLLVSSAAAEKVYRSTGPASEISVRLDVAAGARLAWMPQETILFDGARLIRGIEVDLTGDAQLLLAEAVVFGRTAMHEVVSQGCLIDRWRVRRDGRLIFADCARLDGAIAALLQETAIAAGGLAMATVLLVPADNAAIAAVRLCGQHCRGEIGISSWNGFALARLCGRDGATLRHDLTLLMSALRGKALPRLWC
jgi:urease accessory protein